MPKSRTRLQLLDLKPLEMLGPLRGETLGSTDVPEEETAAAPLSASKSSVGHMRPRKQDEIAADGGGEEKSVEAPSRGSSSQTIPAEMQESMAEHPAPAEESPHKGETGTSSVGEKRIPPGAIRMVSMSTVEEFQKKLAERRTRMSDR